MRRGLIAVALLLAGCGGSTPSSNPSSSTSTATATAASTSITASTSEQVTPPPTTTSTTPAPPGVTPGQKLASGFHLTSPAFKPGGPIPPAYTCDGSGTPLPLHWTGVPQAAKELVLVMRDPDAGGRGSQSPFVHWAVAGIPPTSTRLPAGNVILGRNSFGANAYGGPCPPTGSRAHHYVLTLSALASTSGLRPGFSPDQLRARALAIATLIGTYARR